MDHKASKQQPQGLGHYRATGGTNTRGLQGLRPRDVALRPGSEAVVEIAGGEERLQQAIAALAIASLIKQGLTRPEAAATIASSPMPGGGTRFQLPAPANVEKPLTQENIQKALSEARSQLEPGARSFVRQNFGEPQSPTGNAVNRTALGVTAVAAGTTAAATFGSQADTNTDSVSATVEGVFDAVADLTVAATDTIAQGLELAFGPSAGD